MEWLVYICFAIGLLLVIISIFGFNNRTGNSSGYDMENAIRAMDESINEADNTANELVKISQGVVSEIDDKYQQLLYLYSLIEEKTISIKSTGGIDLSVSDATGLEFKAEETKAKARSKGLNPNLVNEKYKAVFDLHNRGLSTPDIARTLNIGQGEVKIVLELGKER